MSNPLFIKAPFLTRKNFFNTNKTNNVFCLIYPFYGSPDKPGGLSIQLCKSEKKEFYIRYSS